MNVNLKRISGVWDLGYSLDKHTIKSTCIGHYPSGHPMFDTLRTEVGEALHQLKNRQDFKQVPILANQITSSLGGTFSSSSLVIPMVPSKIRHTQPVVELARAVSSNMKIPCIENLLVKTKETQQMKDVGTKAEKIAMLQDAFQVNDVLDADGLYDVLIVDDLYDSGSSLEVATNALRQYAKIRNIYVATISWR